MSLVSPVLKLIAGLGALVVLVYLGVNGVALAQGASERERVADEVTVELARVLPDAAAAQQSVVDTADREPDRRWIEQACDFSTDDAGWTVQNHRETCLLRSVTAWQVDSEQDARRLVSPAGEAMVPYDGCVPLGVVEGAEATYVDPTAAADEPWCTYDLGTSVEARALEGERAPLGEGRWLMVVAEQPLVDEPIGCARWSVIFCDNPWTGHAFGERPAG